MVNIYIYNMRLSVCRQTRVGSTPRPEADILIDLSADIAAPNEEVHTCWTIYIYIYINIAVLNNTMMIMKILIYASFCTKY